MVEESFLEEVEDKELGGREEAPSWMDREEAPGIGKGQQEWAVPSDSSAFSSPLMISSVSLPSCSPRLPEGTAVCFSWHLAQAVCSIKVS